LQLEPATSPETLYHGTGHQTAEIIGQTGLDKMRRHHVHLSSDLETTRAVGARHGRPVLFTVDAAAMTEAGYRFYRSENGVWLTDAVPPEFLTLYSP
jgi:putative RNA 2'-phosphotransferase